MKKWVVLAVGLLVSSSACDDGGEPGQTSGSGAGSGTGSTSSGMMVECGDLADTVLEGNCRDCANTGCCAELAACEGAACRDRFACEVGCSGDAGCLAACAADNPGGEAAAAVSSCLAESCDVCAVPPAICGGELSLGSPACNACISENCCTEVDACLADADCKLCVESGEPSLCDMNTIYDATIACFDDNCGTPCGG